MSSIPRFIYVLFALLALWLLLGNVWLSREKAETRRLEAEVPPITQADHALMDRQKLDAIYLWVQEQKEARAVFERDLREGKLPSLPGVSR